MKSPEHLLPALGARLGIELSVKRDDLLPLYMGGNKVRKNQNILRVLNAQRGSVDVIITNGSVHSNHARVCALMAAAEEIKCHLVLHGEKPNSVYLHGNAFFVEATGAKVEYVAPERIADTIERAKASYEAQGLKVAVIPGGGHSVSGAQAYVEAVDELESEPDCIVMASGTGATQAGLIAGVKSRGWKTRVIGVSVARENPRGTDAIYEVYAPLMKGQGLEYTRDDIVFNVDYRQGGYGQYSAGSIDRLRDIVAITGIGFDPVYTGKAILGLCDLVETGEIAADSKVLFWHTGGLLNLQTAEVKHD